MACSDWELIQRCRRGNLAAWQQLIQRYERLVFAIPLRYGLTRDDSADIAQLSFTLLLEQIDQFHSESNIKGWLATVARRHSWRVLQRYDHETLQSPEDLQEGAAALGLSVSDKTDDRAIVEWLHFGLEGLGERCRELLLMLYFDDNEPSYDDIAQAMQMRRGSIGPTRQRCLAKLRELLEADTAQKQLRP